ncbi:MAG: SDR family NAD(P)-dependent oxidoreductase [Alphaproteobacteria bacterium]
MARKRRGRGRTALITGASGGIGEALAAQFAAEGYDLILTARSAPRLELLASDLSSGHGVQVMTVPLDLTRPEAAGELAQETGRLGRHVDVLVNNAGYGLLGPFVSLSHDDQLAMVDVNVRVLTDLTRTFLPLMIGQGSGGVLNISSTAAFQPGPDMAVYYAGKAYVLSLSEALNAELKGTGVHVTCVCPGPVITGFQERSGVGGANLLKLMPVMSAAKVAKKAVRAFHARRAVIIPGFVNWFMAKSVALTPRFVLLPLVRFMHRGD